MDNSLDHLPLFEDGPTEHTLMEGTVDELITEIKSILKQDQFPGMILNFALHAVPGGGTVREVLEDIPYTGGGDLKVPLNAVRKILQTVSGRFARDKAIVDRILSEYSILFGMNREEIIKATVHTKGMGYTLKDRERLVEKVLKEVN